MQIKKWHIAAGSALAVVAAATAVTMVVVSASTAEPDPPAATPPRTPTPTASPTPEPVALPSSVPALGGLDGWALAPTTSVARVVPQVGDAASGTVSAYIDAPVVDAPTTVLEATVALEPGVTYDFSAVVRSLTPLPENVPAAIAVGDKTVALPALDASWHPIEAVYTAPSDATSVAVRVTVSGPVSGFGIDDVALAPQGGGTSVVPNGSFESVATSDTIINRSLVVPEREPLLAVRVPAGETRWEATVGGEVAASGVADVPTGLDAIPLDGLEQGYYTVTVTDAGGTATATTLSVVDFDGVSIASDDRFGVGLHVENDPYLDAADLTASLGIGLARNDILWRHNEKSRGVYEFDQRYVDGFARLHAHGIPLLGIVNYGNELYGNRQIPDTPEAQAAYGRYAAAIAERFDLAGLEVFNEFNHERFNKSGCGTAPECYVPLLQSVHDAVAAVDPELPIVAGSTALYEDHWFDGLWQAGGMQYADAASFHPYQVDGDPDALAGIMTEAYQSMQDITGTTIPVWITELGTPSKTGGRSVEQQAEYLARTTVTALAGGAEHFFWYDLVNDDPDPAVHEGNFGLFYQKRAGVAALQPKPSAHAQAVMINEIGGRAYLDREALGDGVLSYRFGTETDVARAVWVPGGAKDVQIPSDSPLVVATLTGAAQTIEPVNGIVTATIGTTPVFITDAAPERRTPGTDGGESGADEVDAES